MASHPPKPGPRNLITDVAGLLVGNAEDQAVRTGTTVLLPDAPDRKWTAAVDVRGGAPGTRETDALGVTTLVDTIHGLVLSGGSAFGLDAAQGCMQWLADRGRGFPVGPVQVPVVPAAILFDLLNGGDKDWGKTPPYRALAETACDRAGLAFALGNAGAGYGAIAGSVKGGLGSASIMASEGFTVGALIAVNAYGSPVMPGSSTLWAWPYELNQEMGGQKPPTGPVSSDPLIDTGGAAAVGENTTIGVVAVDADLTRAEALRVAMMAHDGMARALRPIHTPYDGDTLFVIATGTQPLRSDRRPSDLLLLGALAADTVTRAIGRGVYEAETLGKRRSYREAYGVP